MNKDIKNYFNSIWSKNHQVVVAPPQSTDFANFTYCGCGFVVQYKCYKFFITADHVIHGEHFEADERNVEDNVVGVLQCKNDMECYASLVVPLGGIYDFTKYQIPKSKDDLVFPELVDVAFCKVDEELEACVTIELRIENEIIVSAGEPKGFITTELFLEHPSKDELYVITGTILKVHQNGIRFSPLNAVYCGLKYIETENNLFHLKYPQIIDYQQWAGLSGSPVFNNEGKLLGMLLRVEDGGHAVWIKPISEIVKLLDYSLTIEKLDLDNKIQ